MRTIWIPKTSCCKLERTLKKCRLNLTGTQPLCATCPDQRRLQYVLAHLIHRLRLQFLRIRLRLGKGTASTLRNLGHYTASSSYNPVTNTQSPA